MRESKRSVEKFDQRVAKCVGIPFATAAVIATCLATFDAILPAQEPGRAPTIQERAADPVYMSWVAQQKVTDCIKCHTGLTAAEILAGNATRLTAFSRRNEMEYWLSSDKHTIARRRVEPYRGEDEEAELEAMLDGLIEQQAKVVEDLKAAGIANVPLENVLPKTIPEEWVGDSNILSRRICDKLWGDGAVTKPDGYALFRENCLTCHGGYQSGDVGFTLEAKGREQIGIDCLYCHQKGAEMLWVERHQFPDRWRLLPPEQKSQAGMRDLVGTANQADLCFDCHIGNRDKNMFVNHEMYAAGHPPIPSIELHTFCGEMPQHWQTPSQLYKSLENFPNRDEYFQTNYPGVTDSIGPGNVFWNTRKMLIGALTARRKAIDLYVDSAGGAHGWADYSLYDCAACHHELETQSLRQLRGFPGAPGRPRQHEWPDALLNILYEESTLADSKQLEQTLTQHFSTKPFGDPIAIRPTAMQLRDKIDAAIGNLERKPVNASVALRLLGKLAGTDRSRIVTYDSARQVVWAMQTIVDELEAAGDPVDARVAELVHALGEPTTAGINAALPSGRGTFIYAEALREDLRRRSEYHPALLAEKLDEIRRHLEEG